MKKIKNFERLTVNTKRRIALSIAEAGLWAIDTENVIKSAVSLKENYLIVKNKKFSLKNIKRIFIVGVGKCAIEAGLALEKVLGGRLKGGIILAPRNFLIQRKTKSKLKIFFGNHPIPTITNVRGTQKVIAFLKNLKKDDFVIFVISGGGSTLLCLPPSGSYLEERKIIDHLFRVGATIQDINVLRKHMSLARGGYLAYYAYPAQSLSLIFSDVPRNDIQFISSGPTVRDKTTMVDARKILKKYDILKSCGIKNCGLVETPKDKKFFKNAKKIILVSNILALEKMKKEAEKFGLRAKICDFCLQGEARDIGQEIVKKLHRLPPKTILLYGGETTVTIKGYGCGGRNQELVLSALLDLKDDEIIMAIATDGRDNTEYAGALGDGITKKRARELNLEIKKFLIDNNSYEFWQKTGDYLLTGETGSNVSDLIIAIKF